MKIISNLLSISLICLSQLTFSQSDFRNGFVILHSGDTINGYLDYKGNPSNAQKCVFRSSLESSNVVYTTNDLRAYRFNDGKYFVSKSLPSPSSNTTLFLEYLINGIVDVYYYRDNDGEHYLLENEEGKLIELKETQRESIINGTTYQSSLKEYVGILKVEFSKDMNVAQQVDNVGLNHKSLIQIVNKYHDSVCEEYECIIYEKKLPKSNRSFGLVVGAQTIEFSVDRRFPSQERFDIEGFDFQKSLAVGFFYKQNMPYLNERLNILYELTYSKMLFEKQWTHEEFLVTINQDESLVNHTFNNNLSILYQFPKRAVQPMIFTGIFFNFFESSYEWHYESISNSDGEVLGTDYSSENPFLKKDYGYAVGLGLRSESFFDRELYLSLKYQHGFGFRDNLNTNSLHLNFGVGF